MSIDKICVTKYAGCTNWFVKTTSAIIAVKEVCFYVTVSPCEDETATTAASATAH